MPLRRGMTVKGRVIGPDGRPIPDRPAMIGRVFLMPSPGAWLSWRLNYQAACETAGSRSTGSTPTPKSPSTSSSRSTSWARRSMLSGKSGAGGPVTVRLQPCGTARAPARRPGREAGRRVSPRAGSRWSSRPGLIELDRTSPANWSPMQRPVGGSTRSTTADGPVSDAEGRITLPALIPGATYQHPQRSPRRPGLVPQGIHRQAWRDA